MSFLDNLENNLKALESREQGGIESGDRREADRRRAKAAAPWAERLKSDRWTQSLMQQVTRAGFQRRTKVNLVWIGTTLRLEARGHRLELRPVPDGIAAVFLKGIEETRRQRIDLSGDPRILIEEWMPLIDTQKKIDDELVARMADVDTLEE